MNTLNYTIQTNDNNPFIQLFVQWYYKDLYDGKLDIEHEGTYVQCKKDGTDYALQFVQKINDKYYTKEVILKEYTNDAIYFKVIQGVDYVDLNTTNNLFFTTKATRNVGDNTYLMFNDAGIYAVIDMTALKSTKTNTWYKVWDFNVLRPPVYTERYTELSLIDKKGEELSRLVLNSDVSLYSGNRFNISITDGIIQFAQDYIIPTIIESPDSIRYINGKAPISGNINIVVNTKPPTTVTTTTDKSNSTETMLVFGPRYS